MDSDEPQPEISYEPLRRTESFFKYIPLDIGTKHIRLITVSPGERNDPLICTLSHQDLGTRNHRPYETISYCWGDASIRSAITLNNLPLSVPSSTAASLRGVRLTNKPRTVWLDAVCINQNDMEERGLQVAMMGDIYRKGSANLIYLGDEDISEAITSINAILEEANATEGSFTKLRNDVGAWQYSSTGIRVDYSVKALLDLFRIPWFRRAWVLQEAALARSNRCFCGFLSVDLVDITRVGAWLVYNYYFVDPELRLQCSYAADMNDLVDSIYGYHRNKDGKAPGALYLLDLAQQRLATNPIDKLYGILALNTDADGTTQLDIFPDYKKSIAEAFRDAAWCLVKKDGDFSILDYVRHRDGGPGDAELSDSDFPSWVPKWHVGKDMDEDPNFMSLSFDACAGRKSAVATLNPNGIASHLAVNGFEVATIKSLSERMTTEALSQADTLRDLLMRVDGMVANAANCSQDQRTLAIASTLVAGVDVHYKPVTQAIVQGYSILHDLLGPTGHQPPVLLPSISALPPDADPSTKMACQYREAMSNACMNRAFFVTDADKDGNSYFGLGPYFMRKNDVVAILYGMQFPVALRPAGGKWLFLGTCYVNGIMSGEALEGRVEDDESVFELC